MTVYKVDDAHTLLWTTTTDEVDVYDINVFPAEYLDNPSSGTVYLWVDSGTENVLIGVQHPTVGA